MSFKFNRSGSMQELNKLLIAVYPYLNKSIGWYNIWHFFLLNATLEKWKKISKNVIEFLQQNKSSAYIFHVFYPLQTQVEAEILRRGC